MCFMLAIFMCFMCGIIWEVRNMASSWSVTDLRKETFEFEWIVKDNEISGQVLMSPAYPHNGRKWCLHLERNNAVDATSRTYCTFMILKLGLVSSPKLPVLANYSFSYKKKGLKSILESTGSVQIFQKLNSYEKAFNLFKTNDKSDYFVNGKLTLCCEVEIFDDRLVIPKFVPENIPQVNFSSLLAAGHFDVTLVAGEKEFRAHKLILSGRSPVFAQMFEHDMKEKSTNTVEIDDIEPEILEEMITYIYTGDTPLLNAPKTKTITAPKEAANDTSNTATQDTTSEAEPASTEANKSDSEVAKDSASAVESPPPPDPREVAKKLLYAADKYEIEGLVKCCEKVLYENLSVQNAVETVILADKHNATQLRRICISFIVDHQPEVSKTNKWSEVLEDIDILQEIYQATVEKYQLPPTAKKLRLYTENDSLQMRYHWW